MWIIAQFIAWLLFVSGACLATVTSVTLAFPQNSCYFNPQGLTRYVASGWVGSAVYPLDFASFDLEDDDVVEKMQTWASEVEKKFLEGGY